MYHNKPVCVSIVDTTIIESSIHAWVSAGAGGFPNHQSYHHRPAVSSNTVWPMTIGKRRLLARRESGRRAEGDSGGSTLPGEEELSSAHC